MTGRKRSWRLRGVHTAVTAAVLVALVAVNGPPVVTFIRSEYHNWLINTASYKKRYGHWAMVAVPTDMRVNAVHAIMLYTGKVLIMAGSGNNEGNFAAGRFESVLWDPSTNKFTKLKTPSDMFCGGHVILPDGNVLIAGGTRRYEVLPNKIRYAAGIMTVTNRALGRKVTIPEGTIFTAPSGERYWATESESIPPVTRMSGRGVIVPTRTELWVKAVQPGKAPISRRAQNYTIEGISGRAAAGIQATAWSITRDLQTFWGSRKSYIFNPVSERYEAVSDLNVARWYPTLAPLEGGKVLAVSGLDEYGQIIKGTTEEWTPKTRAWRVDRTLTKPFPTYPALFLTPSDNLFFTGSNAGYGPAIPSWRTPGIWNTTTNAFKPVPGLRDPNLTETSGSVLLPPAQDQRYAIIGGGGVGQSNVGTGRIDVVDLKSRSPRWHPAGSLPEPTRYPEVVITPDDKVVITGGSRDYRGEHGSDIFECHMYDPQTNHLTSLANPTVGRDYHAEALLLPDGRILTLGGNPLFGNKSDTSPGYFEQRIEVFSPPYLFHGPRPRLTAGPKQLAHGATGVFSTPDAAKIATARLMAPSAVTHVTDVQQRSIALGLHRRDNAVALTVPSSQGLVPSGWYMLFVTYANGTPSVSRWVHIS